MKHKCENFLESNSLGHSCSKCRTPEWALYYPAFRHKIGSKVTLPLGYTDCNKVFIVLKHDKNGYTIGETKDNPTQWFNWWELYPVKQKEKCDSSR